MSASSEGCGSAFLRPLAVSEVRRFYPDEGRVSWNKLPRITYALGVSLYLKQIQLQGIPLLYINSPPQCPKEDCREELTAEDGAKVFASMFCIIKLAAILIVCYSDIFHVIMLHHR